MKERYYDAIVNGVSKSSFPPVPVDYGYRDSTNFWYTRFPRLARPIAEPVPAPKEVDIESIRYAANRADDTVKFTDEALRNFVKVPRPFLKTVLNGCVAWAKENGVELITDEHVKIINDKCRAEKDRRRGTPGGRSGAIPSVPLARVQLVPPIRPLVPRRPPFSPRASTLVAWGRAPIVSADAPIVSVRPGKGSASIYLR